MYRILIPCIVTVLCVFGNAKSAKTLPDFSGDEMMLVDQGKAKATIVIAANATAMETKAAAELQHYLKLISGAELPIITDDQEIRGNILSVGRNKLQKNSGVDVPNDFYPNPEAIRIKRVDRMLVVLGNDAPQASEIFPYQGTLYSVYAFLEGLGCRWFMPGELGQIVPDMQTISIRKIDLADQPGFVCRVPLWVGYGYNNKWVDPKYRYKLPDSQRAEWFDWMYRNRQRGLSINTRHDFFYTIKPGWFDQHPEYFSLLNGKRVAAEHNSQICTANPDVIRIYADTIIDFFDKNPGILTHSLSPNDGGGWCQCQPCLDQHENLIDRYVVFFNAVAERVEKRYPDRLLAFYVYYDLTDVPKDVKPHRMLLPVIANYNRTDQTKPMTGDTESARYYRKIIDDWGGLCEQIGIREYFGYSPQFPKPIVSVIRENIPYWKSKKAISMNSEGGENWGSNGVVWYIAAKLLWDPQLDVDWLLDDYFTKMYGNASVPMRNYFDTLETTFANVKGQVALGVDRIPEIFNPVVDDLEVATKQAQALAQDEGVKRRVDFMARSFDYVKKYLAMRNTHTTYLSDPTEENYTQAVAAMQILIDTMDSLKDSYVINVPAMWGSYPRQRRANMVKAREALRLSMQSVEFVQSLPQFWRFQKDIKDTGQSNDWHSPDFDDSNWDLLSIMGNWESQIGEYDGLGWYRVKVKLPELVADKKYYVRFEAIDESAWVYVNGRAVGSLVYDAQKNPDSWKEAIRFDITDAVVSGRENVFAVKVQDLRGTGGIWKGASIIADNDEQLTQPD